MNLPGKSARPRKLESRGGAAFRAVNPPADETPNPDFEGALPEGDQVPRAASAAFEACPARPYETRARLPIGTRHLALRVRYAVVGSSGLRFSWPVAGRTSALGCTTARSYDRPLARFVLRNPHADGRQGFVSSKMGTPFTHGLTGFFLESGYLFTSINHQPSGNCELQN